MKKHMKIENFPLHFSLYVITFYLKMQVEQNVDFVQRKRDEVAFSPKDHQSVESFLQVLFLSYPRPFFVLRDTIISDFWISYTVCSLKSLELFIHSSSPIEATLKKLLLEVHLKRGKEGNKFLSFSFK